MVRFQFDRSEFKEESQKVKNKIDYLNELREIAISKGGNCLSEEYTNNKSKLKFICNKGHHWQATPNSIKDGTWCPECHLNKEGYLNEIQDIAKSHGGRCLSKEYINAHTHLEFQCELNHTWMAKPNSIKNGTWCPWCSQGLSERICRKFFEEIFGKKFPKTTFNWLKNINGNKMHLDGYNNELRLAFEYNGEQHYKFKKFWHETEEKFAMRKLNDRLKKKLCKEHQITLIIVPYTVPPEKMDRFIRKKYNENGIISSKNSNSLDWKDFNIASPKRLEELKQIASKRGGKLLSKFYYNNRTKLEFQCGKGHKWWATPTRIKSGDWCPICYEDCIRELQESKVESLKSIIRKKGGKLISDYVNKRTKITIECSQGHRWDVLPSSISDGTWCPDCYHDKEFYLNEIREIARMRGGICLSSEYFNNKTNLKFRCANGHEWWARPKSIKERTWCPHCY